MTATVVQTFTTDRNQNVTMVDITLTKPPGRRRFVFDPPVFVAKGQTHGLMVWQIDDVLRADLVRREGPPKRSRRSRRRWRHKVLFRTIAVGRAG